MCQLQLVSLAFELDGFAAPYAYLASEARTQMKILIAIDKDFKIDSNGIIELLNNKTNYLKFDAYSKSIKFKDSYISTPSSFKEIETKFKSYLKDYSHIFCFTEKPYDDNYFFHEHNGLSIVSSYGWSSLTSLPKTNGLVYFILAYLLLNLDTSDFRHHEETGCMFDFLWNKDGIDDGMRQAKICPTCLDRITRGMNKEDNFLLLEDIKILMNLLSNSSKWNKNILDELESNNKKTISKRKPKKPSEINIVIASPGDTHQERKVLLDALEIQFRKGNHEAHCKHRLIVHGWEDLASQNGYPQDVINKKIIQEVDFVVSLFKHKLGTPTINQVTGSVRAESGTVEELLQALDYSNDSPLGMAYFYSKAPVISLDSPDFKDIQGEWERLVKFRNSIRSKMIYKPYTESGELLKTVIDDLEKNIISFFS